MVMAVVHQGVVSGTAAFQLQVVQKYKYFYEKNVFILLILIIFISKLAILIKNLI